MLLFLLSLLKIFIMRTKEQFIKEQIEWLNENEHLITSGTYAVTFYEHTLVFLYFTKVNNKWTLISSY
jgi:hypothetical protein